MPQIWSASYVSAMEHEQVLTSALDSALAGVLFVGDRDDSTGIDGLVITAMRAFTYTRRRWLIAIRLDDDLYVSATFAAPCQHDP